MSIAILLWCFVVTLAFSSACFVVFQHMNRIDGVDIIWGLMFIVCAVTALLMTSDNGQDELYPKLLVMAMISIWGFRLSGHIYRRFKKSSQVDKRYTEIQSKWPQRAMGLQAYVRIFVVQTVLAVIISLPAIVVMAHERVVHPVLIAIGSLVWLGGFIIEVVADKQLRNFIAQASPKHALMRSGIWRYSRHPNYFGEITQWWGIAVIALAVTPLGVVGLVGPLTLTGLMVFVSGLPMTERHMSTKPGWHEYATRTSILIPLPPKKQ